MSNLKMQAELFAEQRDNAMKEMKKRNPSASYENLSDSWTIMKLAELQIQINSLKHTTNHLNKIGL